MARRAQWSIASIAPGKGSSFIYGLLIGAALLLSWLAREHQPLLPSWAPWDFSFVEFLGCWLALFWYWRGLSRTLPEYRPVIARQVAFITGILVIYGVLETHYEYLAEHQFFFNRVQHVVMHHVGPLLIAVAWPGETLTRGMPSRMKLFRQNRIVHRIVNVLQQPVMAVSLFVGSFFFWLVPAIHFRAMIDPRIFALMNWTMVADGILFWVLVLDPRPSPPARTAFGTRAFLALIVIFPQIAGGALIALSPRDLYPFYNLCGRIYPGVGAHYDQMIGGLIIWIPPAMMSVWALVLVIRNWRLSGQWQWQE